MFCSTCDFSEAEFSICAHKSTMSMTCYVSIIWMIVHYSAYACPQCYHRHTQIHTGHAVGLHHTYMYTCTCLVQCLAGRAGSLSACQRCIFGSSCRQTTESAIFSNIKIICMIINQSNVVSTNYSLDLVAYLSNSISTQFSHTENGL